MKKCLFCKGDFAVVNNNQKYCSTKCRRSIRTNCGQCEEPIIRLERSNTDVFFCTRSCAELYKGNRVVKNCGYCDEEFLIKHSASKYGNGVYCSNECADKSKIRRVEKNCPNCGDVFSTGANHVDNRTYCKKECFYESMMIDIPKVELERLYLVDKKTTREIAFLYNTDKKVVCDYLHRYEIEVRPDTFPGHNFCKCKNGLVVRSNYERAFINALITFGIDFEYEPRLPFDKRRSADLLVKDVYVEIWGMVGWDVYDDRKRIKKKLYKENNFKLFSVYPEDFKDVYGKVNELKHLIN